MSTLSAQNMALIKRRLRDLVLWEWEIYLYGAGASGCGGRRLWSLLRLFLQADVLIEEMADRLDSEKVKSSITRVS